jgi:hypothetical protein
MQVPYAPIDLIQDCHYSKLCSIIIHAINDIHTVFTFIIVKE